MAKVVTPRTPLCVAVLDTMYTGRHGKAPRYFQINPYNKTGKRLYWFVEDKYKLLVTNACPQMMVHAHEHGKPDPVWLEDNLRRLFPIALLLVCGSIAVKTFADTGLQGDNGNIGKILTLPHPAYRAWTREMLDETKAVIQGGNYAR